jgi:nitrate reductase gamma subunit
MSGFLTSFYAILLYCATFVLIAGVSYKIFIYSRTPAPLKIPVSPAPLTQSGVILRMFREVVFFESLFKSNKWIWLFGWIFHFSLLLVLLRHLRYFMEPVPLWVALIQPFGKYAAFGMVIGLAGLLARRIFVDRIRYISNPSDYGMLLLLIFIALSGMLMTFISAGHTDIIALKSFVLGLMSLNWQDIPTEIGVLLHLLLVAFLMFIFPISKLIHAPGMFFSPTRNQVDNARSKRHISSWAKKLED